MTKLSIDNTFLVWQGFDHNWLRTVAGFAVPHRISRFESILEQESLEAPQGAASEPALFASFRMGQDTGVDGNYMKPIGYLAGGYHRALKVVRVSVPLEFSDELEDGPFPQAKSDWEELVEVPWERLGVDSAEGLTAGVLLSGIALQSSCDGNRSVPLRIK